MFYCCRHCSEPCEPTNDLPNNHTVPCDYCAEYGGRGTEPIGDAR